MKNDQFYSNLQVYKDSLKSLFDKKEQFKSVPEDWYLVFTDIKGSTQAVANGQHETVNLIAAGSVIAALNIAKKVEIEIPFFFGGDGATLLVPNSLIEPINQSLRIHSNNVKRDFGLELRVGCMKVGNIYKEGHSIQLTKFQLDPFYSIPIVSGKGLIYAEDYLKKLNQSDNSIEEVELDLSGMECRWNKIKPPKNTKEIVCLLVLIQNQKEDLSIYKKVIETIENIYGPKKTRNPISVKGMSVNASLSKIRRETIVKFGKMDWLYLLKTSLISWLGSFIYLKWDKAGRHYLKRLVELSDSLVIDGRISTVIAGTSSQREKLLQELDGLEEAGDILYGFFVSKESIMSCYVQDRMNQHIHFVDGSEGGYTMASKILKKKIQAI